MVAKFDGLARSPGDAHDIIDELTAQDAKLSIGGSVDGRSDVELT